MQIEGPYRQVLCLVKVHVSKHDACHIKSVMSHGSKRVSSVTHSSVPPELPQVPRLPRKIKNHISKCYTGYAKFNGITRNQANRAYHQGQTSAINGMPVLQNQNPLLLCKVKRYNMTPGSGTQSLASFRTERVRAVFT